MKNIILLFFIVTAEFLLESVIAKHYYKSKNLFYRIFKEHHFSFWRYLIFFGVPFTTILVYIFRIERTLLAAFVVFMLIGTFLEWLIGFAYHNVVRKRLWTYHKYSIGGYTSFLSIPIWGLAGILFWVLIKSLT